MRYQVTTLQRRTRTARVISRIRSKRVINRTRRKRVISKILRERTTSKIQRERSKIPVTWAAVVKTLIHGTSMMERRTILGSQVTMTQAGRMSQADGTTMPAGPQLGKASQLPRPGTASLLIAPRVAPITTHLVAIKATRNCQTRTAEAISTTTRTTPTALRAGTTEAALVATRTVRAILAGTTMEEAILITLVAGTVTGAIPATIKSIPTIMEEITAIRTTQIAQMDGTTMEATIRTTPMVQIDGTIMEETIRTTPRAQMNATIVAETLQTRTTIEAITIIAPTTPTIHLDGTTMALIILVIIRKTLRDRTTTPITIRVAGTRTITILKAMAEEAIRTRITTTLEAIEATVARTRITTLEADIIRTRIKTLEAIAKAIGALVRTAIRGIGFPMATTHKEIITTTGAAISTLHQITRASGTTIVSRVTIGEETTITIILEARTRTIGTRTARVDAIRATRTQIARITLVLARVIARIRTTFQAHQPSLNTTIINPAGIQTWIIPTQQIKVPPTVLIIKTTSTCQITILTVKAVVFLRT